MYSSISDKIYQEIILKVFLSQRLIWTLSEDHGSTRGSWEQRTMGVSEELESDAL
jgi:hypothetical protein